jgi:two-component system sensor kinase FixL
MIREHLERLALLERVGWLAAGLTHDLNNTLACLLGEMGEIRDRLGETRVFLASVLGSAANIPGASLDACESSLERMDQAVQNALSHGRQLQRLHRGESLPAGTWRVDLREAVVRAVNIAPARIRGNVEILGGRVEVGIDRETVVRVVLNLLMNASEATPERRPSIRMQLAVSGAWAVCDVADAGPGIDPEVLPRLFEPFASTRSQGGGLGLAVSRHLLRAAGGDLLLLETGPGGSTFRVLLPLAPRPG